VHLKHIQIEGDVYNLDGRLIKRTTCFQCLYEPNGHTIVFFDNKLYEIDEKSKVLWQMPFYLSHTISKSVINDEYLTLESEYDKDPEVGLARYDKPVVISKGKIIKSFSFLKYFKAHPSERPILKTNTWTNEGNKGKSVEFTHGNSLKELTKMKNGKPELTGYVYFSNHERNLYYFDRDLKKITYTFVAQRRLHDVQPYDEENLIAYNNAVGPYLGAIVLINMKRNTVKSIYRFTEARQYSEGCSSVQSFPGKLFIVHSQCGNQQPNQVLNLEFVDLRSGKSSFAVVEKSFSLQDGKLVDLTSYFAHVFE
jgi:hypothetical protein